MKCEECGFVMDRDIIAVLNIQMRGEGFPQRAPNEITEREELSKNKSNNSHIFLLNPEPSTKYAFYLVIDVGSFPALLLSFSP
ncbi:MAG: hypothetical protein QXL74_03970 [Candidatus Bathyarchaeia archaeon]